MSGFLHLFLQEFTAVDNRVRGVRNRWLMLARNSLFARRHFRRAPWRLSALPSWQPPHPRGARSSGAVLRAEFRRSQMDSFQWILAATLHPIVNFPPFPGWDRAKRLRFNRIAQIDNLFQFLNSIFSQQRMLADLSAQIRENLQFAILYVKKHYAALGESGRPTENILLSEATSAYNYSWSTRRNIVRVGR